MTVLLTHPTSDLLGLGTANDFLTGKRLNQNLVSKKLCITELSL